MFLFFIFSIQWFLCPPFFSSGKLCKSFAQKNWHRMLMKSTRPMSFQECAWVALMGCCITLFQCLSWPRWNTDRLSPLDEVVNQSVGVDVLSSLVSGTCSRSFDHFFGFFLQEFWKEMGEMGLLGITAPGETSAEMYPVNIFVDSYIAWGKTAGVTPA